MGKGSLIGIVLGFRVTYSMMYEMGRVRMQGDAVALRAVVPRLHSMLGLCMKLKFRHVNCTLHAVSGSCRLYYRSQVCQNH